MHGLKDADSLVSALERLIAQAQCPHKNRSGGNDYIECFDCGLMWDYRRAPEQWQATANAELVKRLALAVVRAPQEQTYAGVAQDKSAESVTRRMDERGSDERQGTEPEPSTCASAVAVQTVSPAPTAGVRAPQSQAVDFRTAVFTTLDTADALLKALYPSREARFTIDEIKHALSHIPQDGP